MKKLFFIFVIIFGFYVHIAHANLFGYNFSNSSQNETPIWSEVWNSKAGLGILEDSAYKNDFYSLINFYQPQINPLLCGAATSVIILNALNYGSIPNQEASQIIRPIEIGGGNIEFPLYTQENFFNGKTDIIKNRHIINMKMPSEIKNRRKIYDAGVTLSQLRDILSKSYNLKVEINYVEEIDNEKIDNFRQKLKEVLNDNKKYLLANFDGQIIGKKTFGHISPIVAFNEKEDAILVLDVALHRNQWYWINVKQFFKSMNSKDGENYRGYLVVSKK